MASWSKIYNIITSCRGKPVSIGTAFSKGFKVIVGEAQTQPTQTETQEQPQKKSNPWAAILILLVILIILFLIIKRVYNKKDAQQEIK